MRVTVRLVSLLDIAAGQTEPLAVELADGATGRDLVSIVAEQVRRIPLIHGAVLAGGLMYLVNGTHSSPGAALQDGDKVSLVLRISGI